MIGLEITQWSGKTERHLEKLMRQDFDSILQSCARRGLDALRRATPTDSGKTKDSWTYEIERSKGKIRINWNNTNINQGVNVALLIQYGHGTGTGGYVRGVDYINPALKPVFDSISKEITKAVKSL